MTVDVRLSIRASYCNDWPELEIVANDNVVWHNRVQDLTDIDLSFDRHDKNTIQICYLNKRNGPDAWDTMMEDGRIVADQNAVLTSIVIDRTRCDWLIPDLVYHYPDGTQNCTHGFMDLKGYLNIEFPGDVYPWVVEQRRQRLPHVVRNSSLAYETIYIPDAENAQAQQLIADIKVLIEKIND